MLVFFADSTQAAIQKKNEKNIMERDVSNVMKNWRAQKSLKISENFGELKSNLRNFLIKIHFRWST